MRVLSGILIGLVSKLIFMLSRFEHEINVITSDPELTPSILISHVVNLSNVLGLVPRL